MASALLRMARGSSISPVAGAAFAERDAMYGRLDALLRHEGEVQPNRRRRTLVAAALCALLAIGIALPATATVLVHCNLMGLVS